jgi:hypothetical protein
MQLLKRIIHHADKVQNEYLVPKSNAVEQDNTTAPKPMIMNSILVRRDADVTVINEKCFQRWHQVLQEGLVPLSVVGLNLLQKSTCNIGGSEGVSDEEKEEEAYFASLDGMEEEIQVMAILARAAALSDYAADTNIEHGMEQIHAVMKCIAMLLFHIVLDASSSGSQTTKENVAGATSTNEARKSVAGYDGRIRHVVKLASVDVLACAIVEVVINSSQEDGRSSGAVYNVDDYSSWDISSLKSFLDQTDVGKDAIFGTLFKPPTASVSESGTSVSDGKEHSNENQEDAQTRPDSCEEVIITDEMSLNAEAKFVNSAASSCLLTDVSSVEALDDAVDSSDVDQEETVRESCSIVKSEAWNDQNAEVDGGSENHENEDAELHSRRLFNAQFLATRKFELIERIVAIEIVRFFMAEERELKICRKVPGDVSSMPVDTTTNPDADASEQDKSTNSKYFSSHQIKRGVKIAGAGLALGTVFAVTGGLAAPALAAAIGGITALTGAATATSTALLALLATFKAGAALFGVGGGGLAAYKMNKRTAGLSDFEIRRENIEQYMYLGAPDEKMKKGIEAMLPQLHTTVAVSGWLRDKDKADFQLAWGVQPTCQYDKSEEDTIRIRKMKRFYSIYNPPLVHSCEAFMQILQSKLKRNFSWDR